MSGLEAMVLVGIVVMISISIAAFGAIARKS